MMIDNPKYLLKYINKIEEITKKSENKIGCPSKTDVDPHALLNFNCKPSAFRAAEPVSSPGYGYKIESMLLMPVTFENNKPSIVWIIPIAATTTEIVNAKFKISC